MPFRLPEFPFANPCITITIGKNSSIVIKIVKLASAVLAAEKVKLDALSSKCSGVRRNEDYCLFCSLLYYSFVRQLKDCLNPTATCSSCS